jgi:hypothetical protein
MQDIFILIENFFGGIIIQGIIELVVELLPQTWFTLTSIFMLLLLLTGEWIALSEAKSSSDVCKALSTFAGILIVFVGVRTW